MSVSITFTYIYIIKNKILFGNVKCVIFYEPI